MYKIESKINTKSVDFQSKTEEYKKILSDILVPQSNTNISKINKLDFLANFLNKEFN